MKIYEINEQLRELMALAVNEDGEINEEALAKAQQLEGDKSKKVLAFAKFIKEKKSEIQAMKDAEKSIAVRRKSIENLCARSEDYLMGCFDSKVSDDFIAVSKSRSERVVVVDVVGFIESQMETHFVKESYSVDKAAIKKCLRQDPDSVCGASIEEHYSLQIK